MALVDSLEVTWSRDCSEEGYWVRGVDVKYPEFSNSAANEFVVGDLTDKRFVERVLEYKGDRGNFYHSVPTRYIQPFDEIYQFAADMGGAGYIFTGDHDADVMHNSVTINLNVLESQKEMNERFGKNRTKIFYSSSACAYPEFNQLDPDNPNCSEDSAYPAQPDSEYGWEKLFSESGCISLIIGIMAFLLGLLATTTSLDQKEPGMEGVKKHQQQSAERLHLSQRRVKAIEVWGDEAYKLDPSCLSLNVLKQPEG